MLTLKKWLESMALSAGFGLQFKKTFNQFHTKYLENGRDDMLISIQKGDFEKVKVLIQNRSNDNSKEKQESTVLMMICKFCSAKNEENAVSLVSYLLKRGARVDKKDGSGKTAIYYAKKNGLMTIKQIFQYHVTDILIDQVFQ